MPKRDSSEENIELICSKKFGDFSFCNFIGSLLFNVSSNTELFSFSVIIGF
jgi:hypothetical protein